MGHLLDLFCYYSVILELKLLCLGQGETRLPDTVELGSTTILHAVLGTVYHGQSHIVLKCFFP